MGLFCDAVKWWTSQEASEGEGPAEDTRDMKTPFILDTGSWLLMFRLFLTGTPGLSILFWMLFEIQETQEASLIVMTRWGPSIAALPHVYITHHWIKGNSLRATAERRLSPHCTPLSLGKQLIWMEWNNADQSLQTDNWLLCVAVPQCCGVGVT